MAVHEKELTHLLFLIGPSYSLHFLCVIWPLLWLPGKMASMPYWEAFHLSSEWTQVHVRCGQQTIPEAQPVVTFTRLDFKYTDARNTKLVAVFFQRVACNRNNC